MKSGSIGMKSKEPSKTAKMDGSMIIATPESPSPASKIDENTNTSSGQGEGEDRLVRTDQVIMLIYSFTALGLLFGGAGLIYAIDLDNPPLDELELWSVWSTGAWETQTSDDIYECVMKNLTADGPLVIDRFSYGLIYVIVAITTMACGRVVSKGNMGQAVFVVYTLLAIPVFYSFLVDTAEFLRYLIVSIYETTARRRKPRVLEKFPNLVPFLMMIVIQAVYHIVIAGIIYTFDQFDTYLDAVYYLFQSVSLIGLGDVKLSYVNIQLLFIVFIIFGIVLCSPSVTVIAEWIRKAMRKIGKAATEVKRVPLAEQTLADMMDMIPSDTSASVSPDQDETSISIRMESMERLKKQGEQTSMRTSAATAKQTSEL